MKSEQIIIGAESHDDYSSPFLLSKQGLRVIQLQCTRRCNLSCKHCYSESGPGKKEELSLRRLKTFLSEAFHYGYSYLGVSGGEPLLWHDLYNTLDFARNIGYSTSVSTNATLLTTNNAAALKKLVGIIAVSVDGPEVDHSYLRNSETAFDAMLDGLAILRKEKIPFILSFTLTQYNADKLSWLYDFADKQKAAAVQVHPLLSVGTAKGTMDDAVPDSYECKIASWLLLLLMQKRGKGGPVVHLDVILRTLVEKSDWYNIIKESIEKKQKDIFSNIIPSLVIEPDGCITPFIYGFPRWWSLGFIEKKSLNNMFASWITRCFPFLAGLAENTLKSIDASGAEYCDFFGALQAEALRYDIKEIQSIGDYPN